MMHFVTSSNIPHCCGLVSSVYDCERFRMLPSVSKRTIHIWDEGEWWHRRGLWYCDFVAVQQKLMRTDLAKMPNLRLE